MIEESGLMRTMISDTLRSDPDITVIGTTNGKDGAYMAIKHSTDGVVTGLHKAGNGLAATYLAKTISVVYLNDLFEKPSDRSPNGTKLFHQSFDETHPEEKSDIVIVSYNNRLVGFVVANLLQQKEIVEKPLFKPLDKTNWINTVSIMGNGQVCRFINVTPVCNIIFPISLKNATS